MFFKNPNDLSLTELFLHANFSVCIFIIFVINFSIGLVFGGQVEMNSPKSVMQKKLFSEGIIADEKLWANPFDGLI